MKIINFSLRHWRGDLFGGITAGIVALPLALAFGVQSGLGAIAGVYGAIALGVFAALFGGTNTQVSGPTGPMTVVSSAVVISIAAAVGDASLAFSLAMACFFLAGIFQILFGIIRIGSYVKFIPYPVVSGFMSGIGAIIILLQLFPAMGQDSPKTILDVFGGFPKLLQEINWQALLLTALTVLVIYTFPRLSRKVPSPLVALLLITIITILTGWSVPLIGEIPKGLPALNTDIFSADILGYLGIILVPALTLAALGSIDSLLTSIVADNLTRTRHNSNKELVGQGIGNMVSGLIGGIPGAGATMRTVVNINAGGKTPLSGTIHGLLLLAILLGLGMYASMIPKPVLAGILITVGIGIIDYRGFRDIRKIPRADAVIMILVMLITIFFDLLLAVGIGMMLATILFMKKMSDITEAETNFGILEKISGHLPWDDEKLIHPEIASKIFIKHLYGPLFFGYSSRFQELSRTIKDVKVVVMRFGRVTFVDQSGVYVLEESIMALQNRGIIVLITGLQGQPQKMLQKMGIVPGLIHQEHVFDRFNTCVSWMNQYFSNQKTS